MAEWPSPRARSQSFFGPDAGHFDAQRWRLRGEVAPRSAPLQPGGVGRGGGCGDGPEKQRGEGQFFHSVRSKADAGVSKTRAYVPDAGPALQALAVTASPVFRPSRSFRAQRLEHVAPQRGARGDDRRDESGGCHGNQQTEQPEAGERAAAPQPRGATASAAQPAPAASPAPSSSAASATMTIDRWRAS